jgi:hypothetical protein
MKLAGNPVFFKKSSKNTEEENHCTFQRLFLSSFHILLASFIFSPVLRFSFTFLRLLEASKLKKKR